MIDIEKFICSLMAMQQGGFNTQYLLMSLALKEQGLEYKDGKLVRVANQPKQKFIEDFAKEVTKDKETATKFLKSAGIMDENGELAEPYRVCESTSNWSEEDEKVCTMIIEKLDESFDVTNEQYATAENWLEDLKDRVQPQNK